MIDHRIFDRVLWFDIETTPMTKSYEDLPEANKNAFNFHCKINNIKDEDISEYFWDKSPLLPEYSKIACFSYGKIHYEEDNNYDIRTASYCSGDEGEILDNVSKIMDKCKEKNFILGGHNIKAFDIPFLMRRFVLNGKKIPNFLWNLTKKKPWEQDTIDTKEIWNFGSYMMKSSIFEMTLSLDIPCPKEILLGENVKYEYYKENYDLIKRYCEGDVEATAQIAIRLSTFPM